MPQLDEFVALVKAFATVAAIVLPFAIVLSFRVGGPLLPLQRRRAVTWTGWHCALACIAFIAVPELATALIRPQTIYGCFLDKPFEPRTANHLAHLVGGLLAMPFLVAAWWVIVGAIGGARPEQLGRTFPRWRREALLGVIAWIVVCPAVYLVNLVTLLIYGAVYGSQPPDHPLLDLLQRQGASHALTLLILLESVVAAPIREELFFRGIVQPWLCRHPRGGPLGFTWALLAGLMLRASGVPHSLLGLGGPLLLVVAVIPITLWFAKPDSPTAIHRLAPLRDPEWRRRAVIGLFASAALFANVHAAVWPTPIPLVVLGLGLGWLQLRTQRVLAPIVMHALFNAVACVDMLYQVQSR